MACHLKNILQSCCLRSSFTFFHYFILDNQCDLLLDPVNGEVHQTGRYLGDRAIYTCGHGWEIVGAEERVCQANGEWSNQEPYCKKRGKSAYLISSIKTNTYLTLYRLLNILLIASVFL